MLDVAEALLAIAAVGTVASVVLTVRVVLRG